VFARHGVGVGDIGEVDACAHHVVDAPAQRADGGGDLVEHPGRLRAGVAAVDEARRAVRGRRARDEDALAAAHGARVARQRLPLAAAADAPAPGVAGHRLLLVDLRQRVEVVAQVAAGGEEGRPAVLVAAVAGDPLRAGEGRSEQRAVFVVEREVEDLQVVGAVSSSGASGPRPARCCAASSRRPSRRAAQRCRSR
jgi:hypothetical protein